MSSMPVTCIFMSISIAVVYIYHDEDSHILSRISWSYLNVVFLILFCIIIWFKEMKQGNKNHKVTFSYDDWSQSY